VAQVPAPLQAPELNFLGRGDAQGGVSGRPPTRCRAEPLSVLALRPRRPPFSARQRVPGPAATAPRPGTPFRPGRARLVPKLFPAISLLVGPDRRSSALRPVCGAGVRVQTGVTHTTDPKIRCSGFVFRAVVLGRRVLRAASRARRPCVFGPRPGRTSG